MASRTPLITVQHYENDGCLDYSIHGSQWLQWYAWRLEKYSPEEVKIEMMDKFRQALDRALDMEPK